jgi:hypothetical protein
VYLVVPPTTPIPTEPRAILAAYREGTRTLAGLSEPALLGAARGQVERWMLDETLGRLVNASTGSLGERLAAIDTLVGRTPLTRAQREDIRAGMVRREAARIVEGGGSHAERAAALEAFLWSPIGAGVFSRADEARLRHEVVVASARSIVAGFVSPMGDVEAAYARKERELAALREAGPIPPADYRAYRRELDRRRATALARPW